MELILFLDLFPCASWTEEYEALVYAFHNEPTLLIATLQDFSTRSPIIAYLKKIFFYKSQYPFKSFYSWK